MAVAINAVSLRAEGVHTQVLLRVEVLRYDGIALSHNGWLAWILARKQVGGHARMLG